MNIRMDILIQALAHALDMVEISLTGATTHHGKRIAVLCAAMGRRLGMTEAEVSDLATCALLHDNALTENILSQEGREEESENFAAHCEIGQRNLNKLPLNGNVEGYIVHHHERADGQGLYGLPEGKFPLGAECIAAADMFDVEWHLGGVSPDSLPKLRESIQADISARFTRRAGQALLDVLDADMLASLRDEEIARTVQKAIPAWTLDMENPDLISIAEFVSHIIDCKSAFTKIHSQQIANRAWHMAEFYGYGMAQKIGLYLAASLHDIGKMAIPSAVLEKPGKLDDAEFEIIKTHVAYTRSMLGELGGDITEWASNHHEKLDGSGYPRGMAAADLDFNSRLMTCLDIYQAVSEERPYHPRRSHAETMPILFAMAEKVQIDPAIVRDIDAVMAPWSGKDMHPPEK